MGTVILSSTVTGGTGDIVQQINITCGNKITIVSDVDITVLVSCKNGKWKYSSEPNKVVINIPVSDRLYRENTCQMHDSMDRLMYSAKVVIYPRNVMNLGKIYELRCSYSHHGSVSLRDVILDINEARSEKIYIEMGRNMQTNMVMELEDDLGNTLDGPIPIDKRVRLVCKMKDDIFRRDVIMKNCFAEISNRTPTVLLDDGCGTGIVFGTNQGFTKNGSTMESPLFTIFQPIYGERVDSIYCTYKICNDVCDTHSCSKR